VIMDNGLDTPFGKLCLTSKTFDFEVSPMKNFYSMDGFWIEHPVRVMMLARDGRLEIASVYDPEDGRAIELDHDTLSLVTTEAKLRSNFALDWLKESQN